MKEKIWAAIVECLDANAAKDNIDELLADAVMQVVIECFDSQQEEQLENEKKTIFDDQPTRLPVKYIFRRETYSDGLYGTGDWQKNQVKLVDIETAKKMLKHPDVYVPGELEEATEKISPKVHLGDEAPHLDEARQAVMAMRSVKAVAEFVANNFSGAKLEVQKGAGVEGARLEAIRMIDKYHLPHIEA